MIFKFLLLLLIAQVIYCQDRYQYPGGFQPANRGYPEQGGFQPAYGGYPEQGGYRQPSRGPVSNNGDGYSQNYGQQKNYAHLENPKFDNANIYNQQETSNKANLNSAYFGSATINGRKRNSIHVKKRDAVNGLMENDFKGNVKCLITLNDDLMNLNNNNNQELSTKIKQCINQFILIINKANSSLHPQNQPTNKSKKVNFNLQRNEQVQTKQTFQTQNQITQQQNQQQLLPLLLNQILQQPTQQLQQGSQQLQQGNQQIQQGNQQFQQWNQQIQQGNQQFQQGNQQIQQGNQQYQQGNQQYQQGNQQFQPHILDSASFGTATINGK